MAFTVKHAFVSAVADAGNPNEVGPSEWNADHTITGGGVIQIVNTQTGAVASPTGAIPGDDTIPQITEGLEVMTCAITPTSAANKLKIEVTVYLSSTAISGTAVALFQDSTANALAAMHGSIAAGQSIGLTFLHVMTAGTTSSTTFRVRVGVGVGTGTFNGVTGARIFGGVMASSIVIMEYIP